MPQVFIVNVFANTSHPFVSPLFEDSTFELLPIPEGKRFRGKWIKRYSDLSCFNSDALLTRYLPKRYRNRCVHNDPDLVNMTYGDVKVGRSGLLDRIAKNDWVAFYGLLTPIKNNKPAKKEKGFYIVAAFEVKRVIRELPELKGGTESRRRFIVKKYGRRLGPRILENAHTRRWLQDPTLNDTMRMILVGGSRSKRFARPIPLDREFCERYFLDKHHSPWKWEVKKTELQTMGSYLRSVRLARNPARLIELFLNHGKLSAPRLYSYIVAHDSGFAPCVTKSLLSLACCKPKIRSTATPGDWVMGTTPKKKGSGQLVFLSRINQKLTFANYYCNFSKRRPDNIYQPLRAGTYSQIKNRHHGPKQETRDLSTDAVLLSNEFVYYGGSSIAIPSEFTDLVAVTRGHRKVKKSQSIVQFLGWARQKPWGVQGKPADQVTC